MLGVKVEDPYGARETPQRCDELCPWTHLGFLSFLLSVRSY